MNQTEVFLFATKQRTQWTRLFGIGILLHQPVKPSVFGRVDLALHPLGQKGNHCGPSAEEGHAELLLLVRYPSPEHYYFGLCINYICVYWSIKDRCYILRHWFWPFYFLFAYLIVIPFNLVLQLCLAAWGSLLVQSAMVVLLLPRRQGVANRLVRCHNHLTDISLIAAANPFPALTQNCGKKILISSLNVLKLKITRQQFNSCYPNPYYMLILKFQSRTQIPKKAGKVCKT